MTDIVFVNPPLSLKERYGNLKYGGSSAPPLGLCNLAAVIREKGFETKILDSAALKLDYDGTIKKILENDPKCVGITAATVSIFHAGKVAEMLKKENPDIITVVGGPHITAVPIETMRRFPHIDFGVFGEGEVTFVEFLNNLKEKGWNMKTRFNNIAGMIIRDRGKIKLTKSRPYIKDLDSLPMPAWDLLPKLSQYYQPPIFSFQKTPSTSIVTTRGCSGVCIFCDRAVFGNCIRGFSAEYVLKMFKELYHDYGIRDILMDDDSFVVLRKRLVKFCEMLRKEELDLSWSCNARIDHMNAGVLNLMREAGCWQIAYGVESGSQEILDVLRKNIELDLIRKVLKWTKEAGIRTKGFFMVGNVGETKETIEETITFARETDLDDFQISIFTPFPGSKVYEEIESYGDFEDDWEKMSGWYPVFVPKGLTKDEIFDYQKKAFMSFYLRPKIILSYFSLSLKQINNIPKMFLGGLTMLKTLIKTK